MNQEMAHQVEANVLSLEDTMVLAVSHRVFEDLKNQYDAEIHFDGTTACVVDKNRDAGKISWKSYRHYFILSLWDKTSSIIDSAFWRRYNEPN